MAVINKLPTWVVGWLFVTSFVCIYDGLFILLRPHSLPGGKYSIYWFLYKYYISVDKRYQDLKDNYVYTTTLMNLIEVFLNFVALVLHFRRNRLVIPLTYAVSIMTFWKTVQYFLMFLEFCEGSNYREGNSFMEELVIVTLPNIIWIIMPFATMAVLWNQITPSLSEEHGNRSKTGKKKR